MKDLTFTRSEVQTIKTALYNEIGDDEDKCVSRDVLFDLCGGEPFFKIERYKFKLLISKIIDAGDFPGFEMKEGRGGGIRKVCGKSKVITLSHGETKWLRKFLASFDSNPTGPCSRIWKKLR